MKKTKLIIILIIIHLLGVEIIAQRTGDNPTDTDSKVESKETNTLTSEEKDLIKNQVKKELIENFFKEKDIIYLEANVKVIDNLSEKDKNFITDQSYELIQQKNNILKLDKFGFVKIDKNNKPEKNSIYYNRYKLNIIERGFKYKVIKIEDEKVTLLPLSFKRFKQKKYKRRNKRFNFIKNREIDKTLRSKLYNNKEFVISKDDFNKFAAEPEPLKERLSVGLLSLPFKYRPQDNKSFDTEFNLSSTLNLRLRKFALTDYYLQIGAGIGTVGLNDDNASGVDGKAQDISTLTFLSGVMLQYKKVQAGFYIGVDQINNQDDYRWKSNGNIWFGFGIGYEIFKVSLSDKKQNKNN